MLFSKFSAWYRKQADPAKALVVFAITTGCIILLFFINTLVINIMAGKVMEPIGKSDQLLGATIQGLKKPAFVPGDYFLVFKTQQQIMNQRKEHHLQLARLFFRNYYAVLVLSLVLSCVGGLTLFAMINKGWANAGITLQAFFLTLATGLAFLGLFPLVFKQQDNFNQNMVYYENYTKGELAVYNQLSFLQNPIFPSRKDSSNTTPVVYSVKPDSPAYYHMLDSLVNLNNNTITNLTNYVLSIDASQVKSINDIYHSLESSRRALADSTR